MDNGDPVLVEVETIDTSKYVERDVPVRRGGKAVRA
jgi:hypothetical protein